MRIYSAMTGKLAILILALLAHPTASSAQVAIIAHKSVSVDHLSRTQLIDFYTGDARHWDDGRPIVLFTLRTRTEPRGSFFELLGRSSSRMKSIWMKRMLSGEGDPPETLPSESAVLQRVATTPGAIGYVSPDSTSSAVKLLPIQSKD